MLDTCGSGSSSGKPLRAAIQEQVEEAGLLQRLPGMMLAVSQELCAHTSGEAASSSSKSSKSSRQALAADTIEPEAKAHSLLPLMISLQKVFPQGPPRVSMTVALLPSVSQLISVSLHYVDSHILRVHAAKQQRLQQHQRSGQPVSALLPRDDSLAGTCCDSMYSILTALEGSLSGAEASRAGSCAQQLLPAVPRVDGGRHSVCGNRRGDVPRAGDAVQEQERHYTHSQNP